MGDLSSPTRGRTHTPCIGSMESITGRESLKGSPRKAQMFIFCQFLPIKHCFYCTKNPYTVTVGWFWERVKWKWSCSVMSDPLRPHGLTSLPGSSVHGIFQARILEWVSISFSRGSSQPRDWTQVSRIVGRCFTVWESRSIQKLNSSIFARKSGLCFLYLSFCPWWFKVTARIWRIDNNVVD